MNTFSKTLLILGFLALVLVIGFAFTRDGIAGAGIILFLGSPILFFVGLIITILSSKDVDSRQAGQAILLGSLLYLLVGFTTCSMGHFNI